jgi:hypothetical protein
MVNNSASRVRGVVEALVSSVGRDPQVVGTSASTKIFKFFAASASYLERLRD